MDHYITKKRPRAHTPPTQAAAPPEEESTDIKLAQLVSLFPALPQETLLDILVSSNGSVEAATATLSSAQHPPRPKRKRPAPAQQTSLTSHIQTSGSHPRQIQPRRGKTLHLYAAEDVAAQTPCTLIPNFLPAGQADALLAELLGESGYFSRYRFQLFERTVESPHSACVYVSTPEEYRQHTSEYTYGGTYRSNVRQITPHMKAVSGAVQSAVNEAVRRRIETVYPGGQKLKYQSPREWVPNAAFVNCYDGPAESVGYHSDELTYLGPRAIIGSLSLGVEREFRVRRIVPDDETGQKQSRGDAQGQISIHLPHNSLLVMHAEMQEEWKHAIAPAQTVSPHPLSGNRRINITYRWYRDSLHPRNTPRCRCGMHAILRCVQRKRETRGRYMWMCYAGFAPGKKSCGFFQWAEFDDDGEPVWDREQSDDGAPMLKNFVDN
ncbi:GRF zinc finger domain protein [Aspergillus avenaceus]|uniref:GRF zinc finger domain protein n=1 Tax=Aspergillus avenaceus TaxID=36643 RepID=A0A5N6TPJ3_ASPAV|nr:GRF zinc finger domain protein [Aspergillus avenaceus]